MNKLFIIITIFFFNLGFSQSVSDDSVKVGAVSIKGTWIIDLRPTPDSEPYLKEFKISSIENNTFSGEFYSTKFENGHLNLNWDKVYFAFITNDASNSYFHSGYIEENMVFGISYSPERKFTAPWSGKKKMD